MLTPDDVAWLAGPEGRRAVATARGLPPDPLVRTERLRAELGDARLAALAATQAGLEDSLPASTSRGFPILTRDGLEQGTNPRVAQWRAELLRSLGVTRVLDLTAGLGFDTHAYVEAGLEVSAVERDPGIAAALRVNVPAAQVTCGNAHDVATGGYDAVYIDPARRDPHAPHDGNRARAERDPQRWSPPLSWSLAVPNACIKVAPGIDRALVPDGWHAIWTSSDRRLVEAFLLSPGLNPGRLARSAHVLGAGMLSSGLRESDPADVRAIADWLIEPDDAVIRAGLVSELAREHEGWLIDERIAWVSANAPAGSPFARSYRVIEELPNKVRPLRAALLERGIGNVVVKTRAVDTTPERLRAALRLPGNRGEDVTATLVVTRANGAGITLLVAAAERSQ